MSEVEKQDGDTESAEYKKTFEGLAEGKSLSEIPLEEEAKAPEKKEEAKEPETKAEETELAKDEPPVKEDDGESEAGDDPEKADPKEDTANLAKALKDTKSWGTKLAMEKKALEKELAELKAGGSSPKKVEDAKASIGETRKILEDKIKKVSEDYPELKDTLDLLANLSYEGLSKAKEFEKISEKEAERLEARQRFETEVEPVILESHPDFRKVAFSKEYMAWVEKQSPAMQYAAMNSLDPRDICASLSAYKKANAGGEAEKQRQAEEKRQKGIKENLSTVRGGGSASKTAGKVTKLEDVDPNDREGAFKFLADQEAKAQK